MADPQHVPTLDGFDRGTVRAYRAGLLLAGGGLLGLGVGDGSGRALAVVVVGVTLAVAHVHLYDKRFRWLIQGLGWWGLAIGLLADRVLDAQPAVTASTLGLGLQLAALSALVLKEWFCFRIPLVRATPFALALGVIGGWLGAAVPSQVGYAAGALGVLAVSTAKLRMPLGHDIGDRRHYQI